VSQALAGVLHPAAARDTGGRGLIVVALCDACRSKASLH
jgi:hypothetical protein